jgi:hypothetical protein
LLIDDWTGHAATTHQASRTVSAGTHVIKMEYYEDKASAVAEFRLSQATPTPRP